MRNETRAERYSKKKENAVSLPFSFCATYFQVDGNIAYLARALTCFGGTEMHIIGKVPDRAELKRLSGGHSELLDRVYYYPNPSSFVAHCRKNNKKIVAAELCEGACNLHEYRWDFSAHNVICVGNEMDGVPTEILASATAKVYIPMPGRGFCLNTSQTGNVIAYDFSMKYLETIKNV
jgi:tRNA G18 (ribose-2'-O)-methylase SpoU